LPTRLFHWLLAALVVGSVITAKIGGNAMEWHLRLGLMALALLVFRVLWGFVGGRWSRFANFLYRPGSVLAYLRGQRGPDGHWEVGHSPLGALSVFGLLLLLIVQVATGLVADDDVATTGPLNRFVSSAVAGAGSHWHATFGQYLLYLFVALHVGAVIYYLRAKQRNLIGPMWHGDKLLEPGIPAAADGWAQRLLALVALALGLALAGWVWQLGIT
jgi:cytochrome b